MPNFIPASTRTMAVFDMFAKEKRELSNSEIARLLDLPESSCLDLLHTLREEGYIMRTARTRRFYPTGRLHQIALEIGQNDPLLHAGREAADLLAETTGETACVGRLDNGTVRAVAVQQGKYPLRYVLDVGERIALHSSAMGKALLGTLAPDEAARQLRLKPLRKITGSTVTDPDLIATEVAQSRIRGWYQTQTQSEGGEGMDALAISGLVGAVPLAISLAGPPDRLTKNHERYLHALRKVGAMTFGAAQSFSFD